MNHSLFITDVDQQIVLVIVEIVDDALKSHQPINATNLQKCTRLYSLVSEG